MKQSLFVLLVLCVLRTLSIAHDELSEQREVLTQKIQKDPKNADLYFQRAELFRADGHYKSAEKDYLDARKLQPSMATVDLGLGLSYFETNRLQEAKAALNRFLKIYPDHSEGRVTRGHVYSKLGNTSAATDDYTVSLKTKPSPEIYLERSRLHSKLGKLEQALQGLDEGIQRLGPVVTLQLEAIEIETKLKNYDQALSRVDSISRQAERKETWLAMRGDILIKAGRKEESRKAYEQAMQAVNDLPDSRKNNRYTLELKRKIEASLKQLQ